ncbi:unnamed protein product [Nezara viridula]|uniref:Uncharacterized protein n=1 Tax=Nezara viridula TaxID=85310 RepID=A0A9P0HSZ7_NEZVI|nr:unnamed protein product [Nezara viridula]
MFRNALVFSRGRGFYAEFLPTPRNRKFISLFHWSMFVYLIVRLNYNACISATDCIHVSFKNASRRILSFKKGIYG